MTNDIYQNLAKHLDNLPTGFPSTETGVEIRLLKRLFSPEEAKIAVGLKMKQEPVSVIAERLDRTCLGRYVPKRVDLSQKKRGQIPVYGSPICYRDLGIPCQ